MKKLVMATLVAGIAVYGCSSLQRALGLGLSQNPEVIRNPVYAEIHVKLNAGRRSIDGVELVQSVNEEDCQRFSKNELELLQQHGSGQRPKVEVMSVECKPELSPRYSRLFNNEPSFVTYVSGARGNRFEREMRWIYWGMSVEESDMVCRLVPILKKDRSGAVTCVRALRN